MFVFSRFCNILILLMSSFGLLSTAHATEPQVKKVVLGQHTFGPIGQSIRYFQEQANFKLNVEQAMLVFNEGSEGSDVANAKGDSLTLGIGANPVWLRVVIDNNQEVTQQYRLTIETPWLDAIDVYFIQNSQVYKKVIAGDRLPYEQQEFSYRTFAFETEFPSGISEVLIRVQTDSVMPIPVRLDTVEKAQQRDVTNGYQYGLLYGILIALSLYNGILYFMIRQKEFGIYSLYLLGFVLNSLTYTGVFFTIYTEYHGQYFQDYADELLMMTYTTLGLYFGRTVLKTKSYAPVLNRITVWVSTLIPSIVVISILLGQIYWSTLFAFILNTSFAVLFIALGYTAVKHNVAEAKLFFVSSVVASICISISTGAVWGLVPYNDYTFKAIEAGMAFEAILLAIMLAQRFHQAQDEKNTALRVVQTDELTNLSNRRGLKAKLKLKWVELVYGKKDVSVCVVDIDDFKSINEQHGQAIGDIILINIAKLFTDLSRDEDVIVRWGGDEFLIFLPNISEDSAITIAKKYRDAVKNMSLNNFETDLSVSVSIGISGTMYGQYMGQTLDQISIKHLITQADRALHKNNNRFVSHISTVMETYDSVPLQKEMIPAQ